MQGTFSWPVITTHVSEPGRALPQQHSRREPETFGGSEVQHQTSSNQQTSLERASDQRSKRFEPNRRTEMHRQGSVSFVLVPSCNRKRRGSSTHVWETLAVPSPAATSHGRPRLTLACRDRPWPARLWPAMASHGRPWPAMAGPGRPGPVGNKV